MATFDYSTQAHISAEIEKSIRDQEEAEADGDTSRASALRRRREKLSASLKAAEKAATVTRIVRPRNHIRAAYGGDTVKLDASELLHPAVAAALWTEEEAQAAAKELEARRAAMFTDAPNPAQVAADKALASSSERRRDELERQRTTLPVDARPAEIPSRV